MHITVLGTGNIGGTLGKKWARAGHSVVFGTRDPNSEKVKALLGVIGGSARADSTRAAIAHGEVILVAIPWGAVEEMVRANAEGLRGKVIIDATNNFGAPVINNLKVFVELVPSGVVYRAFNGLGWEIFERPRFGEVVTDLFYTGPDGETRPMMEHLISDVGLNPIWVGDNDRVQLVDNLGALWVTLAFRQGLGRGLMFKMLRR